MASEDISQASCSAITFTKPDTVRFVAKNYHQHFTSRLVSYRERERFTDVIVKCKQLELPCHKVVLAAASSYFNTLFGSGVKKAEPDVVELKTFSPDILSTIIDFIYTAEISLSTNNAQSICTACDELELQDLKEGCDGFLSERVEPFNCLGLYAFSKLHDLKLTMKCAWECMLTRLPDILRLALDQELKMINEGHVIEYISSNDLQVEDETFVFQFVEKWVGVDPRVRESSIERVMEHVRLAFCSPTQLCGLIAESPIMQSNKCLLLQREAMAYQLDPSKRKSIANARTKPRKHTQQVASSKQQVVMLDGYNKAHGKCWYLEERGKTWKEFTTIPEVGCRFFKACVSGDDIIVTGGRISDKETKSAWAYSLSGKKWQVLPCMIDCRSFHASVNVGGEVYVMGGLAGSTASSAINRVEMLDARHQRWTHLAHMKHELYYHLAVNIKQNIFVMAGCDKSGTGSLATQMYDTVSGQWQLKANMPQPCKYGSAVYLNEKIYVVGDATRCCMSYDPRQDAWTTHAKPMQGRNNPAACVLKGKILLCGGYQKNDVEEYDVDTDKWTAWSEPLPAALQYHCMLTVTANMS